MARKSGRYNESIMAIGVLVCTIGIILTITSSLVFNIHGTGIASVALSFMLGGVFFTGWYLYSEKTYHPNSRMVRLEQDEINIIYDALSNDYLTYKDGHDGGHLLRTKMMEMIKRFKKMVDYENAGE